MTELTVPYLTETADLTTVLHARRTARDRQQAEQERHLLAMDRAETRRRELVIEMNRYPDVIRALSLFGVAPMDAVINRQTYAIYLEGDADVHGHRMTVVITLRDHNATSYLNILCACDSAGWERQYRGHMVNTLADDLLNAAEELLARIEAAQDNLQADALLARIDNLQADALLARIEAAQDNLQADALWDRMQR